MGIRFHDVDTNKEKMTYSLVPEVITDKQVEGIRDFKKLNMESDGYTDTKTKRLIGVVPMGVLYNYAHYLGIPTERISEFYQENNCRNMTRLLNEFSAFRVVDSL